MLQWKFGKADAFAESLSLHGAAISTSTDTLKSGQEWFIVQVAANNHAPLRLCFSTAESHSQVHSLFTAVAQLPDVGVDALMKLLDVSLRAPSASVVLLPPAADDSAAANELRARAQALVGTLPGECQR